MNNVGSYTDNKNENNDLVVQIDAIDALIIEQRKRV